MVLVALFLAHLGWKVYIQRLQTGRTYSGIHKNIDYIFLSYYCSISAVALYNYRLGPRIMCYICWWSVKCIQIEKVARLYSGTPDILIQFQKFRRKKTFLEMFTGISQMSGTE